MSHGYLHTMLDMLTGAYNRDDVRNAYSSLPLDTNIGRLFNTLARGALSLSTTRATRYSSGTTLTTRRARY